MQSRNILLFMAVLAVAGVGSLFLGSAVANSEFSTIGVFVAGAFAIATYIALGKHIWILIPVFAAWQGSILILPIPFSVNNLVVGFAIACWLINVATRRASFRYRLTSLDFVISLMICIVVIGYIRNPVSLAAFGGGGDVGARPYFEMGMGLMAYIMLSSIRPDPVWINRVPYITLALASVLAVGGAIAAFFPSTGLIMYQFYTGFVPDMRELSGEVSDRLVVARAGYLAPVAGTIIAILYCKRAPLANLSPKTPWSAISMGVAFLFALLSGFRGAFGTQGVYFAMASWTWWRGKGLLVTVVLGFLAVCLIYGASLIVELPVTIQRSMSFLPGDWNDEMATQAQGSTDFRTEMWHQAWYEGGIKDVWIGDGFRVPTGEIAYYKNLMLGGRVTQEIKAQFYLITGDLHSGPLSTIKYVGIAGLSTLLILIFVISYKYYKLWRYVISSGGNIMVGYFALPAMYFPLLYILIFGSFRTDMPRILVSAGILVLLENAVKEMRARKALEQTKEIST